MICGFFVSMLFICRSMFRNVVAALNEALDITMHLKPLTEHFEVCINKSCLRERKSVRLCLNCIISDSGRNRLHRCATVVSSDDAHDLSGVFSQQVLQLCGQDHCADDGEPIHVQMIRKHKSILFHL